MPRVPAKKQTTKRTPVRALKASTVSIPDDSPIVTNGPEDTNVFAPNVFPFDTSWLDSLTPNTFIPLQSDPSLLAVNCLAEHSSDVPPLDTLDPLFWTRLDMELGLTAAPSAACQPPLLSSNNCAVNSVSRMQAHATSNPLALFARADEHRDFALSVYQAGGLPELAPVCQAPNTQTQPPLPFTEATSSMTDLTIQRLLSDAKEAIFEMNIARNLVQQQRESQS